MDWHLFSPLRCIGMCRRMFGFLEQEDLIGEVDDAAWSA